MTDLAIRTSLTERDYELINQLMPAVVAGWSKADGLTLQHEAERLDGLPTSPVIRSMRQLVDAERTARAEGVGVCGRCGLKRWAADDLQPGDFVCTCDELFDEAVADHA